MAKTAILLNIFSSLRLAFSLLQHTRRGKDPSTLPPTVNAKLKFTITLISTAVCFDKLLGMICDKVMLYYYYH